MIQIRRRGERISPPFLLKPYGGILADRYDRRVMMVVGDLGASLGGCFRLLGKIVQVRLVDINSSNVTVRAYPGISGHIRANSIVCIPAPHPISRNFGLSGRLFSIKNAFFVHSLLPGP